MSTVPGELYRLLDAGTAEQGRRFRVEIPPSSPLFEGHFPGHPILPGIAHLALAERALNGLTGRTGLSAVRSLKLRQPVSPGDLLELSISDPDGAGWARFEIRGEGKTVSSGFVQSAPADGELRDEKIVETSGDFTPVEKFLPHAPPARFIQSILGASDEEIVCVAEFPRLHPLAEGNWFPAYTGIEAAAQAAAVLEALNRRQEHPGPRRGYLVGVREARFANPTLAAGRPLRVSARFQGGASPLSIYQISVGSPGREVVAGTISTFLAD